MVESLLREDKHMEVTQKQKGGVMVCRVKGEIDIDTVPELKGKFREIVESKCRKVLLDFSGVKYIDSLGMVSLIGLSKDLKIFGGAVFLSNLSPKISSIFSITGLEKVFKIYETEEEALRNFGGDKGIK